MNLTKLLEKIERMQVHLDILTTDLREIKKDLEAEGNQKPQKKSGLSDHDRAKLRAKFEKTTFSPRKKKP